MNPQNSPLPQPQNPPASFQPLPPPPYQGQASPPPASFQPQQPLPSPPPPPPPIAPSQPAVTSTPPPFYSPPPSPASLPPQGSPVASSETDESIAPVNPPQSYGESSPSTTPRQSVVDRLIQSNSILVTVSNNPSADQLAACIGITLFLNKIGKHATAVFSGIVPSTLEFLKPDETIENDTDSLRDFIISLDKSKADKLRYKVEDSVVRVYITPYKTSIDEDDFDFSQGEVNVDSIIALGVRKQEDLDKAITAHGKILHDATIISVNDTAGSSIGTLHLDDELASSLCELSVEIMESLDQGAIDEQIATAFLTGIVAETQRFSNDKTTSKTMTISARLMAAGANQQLVATELQASPTGGSIAKMNEEIHEDGELEIEHTPEEKMAAKLKAEPKPTPMPPELPEFSKRAKPKPQKMRTESAVPRSPSAPKPPTSHGVSTPPATTTPPIAPPAPVVPSGPTVKDVKIENHNPGNDSYLAKKSTPEKYSAYSTQPPEMGGTLTASSRDSGNQTPVNLMDPSTDVKPKNNTPKPAVDLTGGNNDGLSSKTIDTIERAVDSNNTIDEVEETINSKHLPQTEPESVATPDVSSARSAVMQAAEKVDPTASIPPTSPVASLTDSSNNVAPSGQATVPSLPQPTTSGPPPAPSQSPVGVASTASSASAPPPVPPPMMPPTPS